MAEEAKHTPGPWSVFDYYSDQDGFISVVAGENELISDVFPTRNRDGTRKRELEEDRSNARLIAAAPDLIASLKRLLRKYEICARLHGLDDTLVAYDSEFARTAIAKAEGRTS